LNNCVLFDDILIKLNALNGTYYEKTHMQ